MAKENDNIYMWFNYRFNYGTFSICGLSNISGLFSSMSLAMDYVINDDRYLYTSRTTIGRLHVPDIEGVLSLFCLTLADTVRAYGIKVLKETAIPEGTYKVDISMSKRFKRKMIMLYTESNKYEIKAGGIGFKGSRCHGGNTHKDTEGCTVVAFNYINDHTIQGTAERPLTTKVRALLKKGNVYWKVTNLPQA